MIEVLKLAILFVFSSYIFFFENLLILVAAFLFLIILLIIMRVPVRSVLVYSIRLLPIILLASGVNLLLNDARYALVTALRFYSTCFAVLCYRKVSSPMQLANAIETVCMPLKLFKISPQDIGLMVCIAVTFIPILLRDFSAISCALKSKGMKLNIRNINYILKPFVVGIFNRTNEITNALKSKAYS
jgi:energy-coupling factor transport system permease protein